MDLILVALIAGIALWIGLVVGYGWGVTAGIEEGRLRRRLDELPRPWE